MQVGALINLSSAYAQVRRSVYEDREMKLCFWGEGERLGGVFRMKKKFEAVQSEGRC